MFQVGGTRSIPHSLRELFEYSAHPFVTYVYLQYQTIGRNAITFEKGPESGYITVCFVVRKTTSELERTILITLYFTGEKTPTFMADVVRVDY
jgi:hypothetical protein